MSEVALRGTTNSLESHPTFLTDVSLADWALELEAAHRIGKALCNTSFAPAAFRGKPDEAAAAILTGKAMGLPPTTALQMFFVIKGRVGSYTDAKVALVRAAGHDVWTVDRSDTSVTVAGRRKGWPEDRVERITITLAQAKTAGWTDNETYAKTPADMLWARAAGRVCKLIASEVLYGIPGVEELDDLPPLQAEATVARVTREEILGTPETPASAPRNSPPDPARHASELDPSAPPDSNVAAQGQAARPGITGPQQKMLHALLGQTGRSDRDVALVYISGELDREVSSTKELSKADAVKVIDGLTVEAAGLEPTLDEDERRD